MQKYVVAALIALMTFFLLGEKAYAVENPLGVPNNRVGIHILFHTELEDAAKLVNTNGGDWGYVIIPIQSGDKDREKWQNFLDTAKKLHVIPIIRLATEGDYFNTKVWRKPEAADILDFANFLNSLHWPVKNRYIVVFNEVNRGDEWGGTANPAEYADLLSYATTVFKDRNADFFIISSGLDNAAATSDTSFNPYTFLDQMTHIIPDIFSQIDGLGSHSYPNPAFAQPPSKQDAMSIASFRHERALVQSLGGKELPVFITETGWSGNVVAPGIIAKYYKDAFSSVWNDDKIVTVTPFLLKAGGGPFTTFSFLTSNNEPTEQYQAVASLPKVKGTPVLTPDLPSVLGKELIKTVPVKTFSEREITNARLVLSDNLKALGKWLLRL